MTITTLPLEAWPARRIGVCSVCGQGPKGLHLDLRDPVCHNCYRGKEVRRIQLDRRARGLCVVPGCDRPLASRAACRFHLERQAVTTNRYRRKLAKAEALGLPHILLGQLSKRCPGCGQEKPLTEYHKNPARKHGVERRCKACVSAYRHAYYAARHPQDPQLG